MKQKKTTISKMFLRNMAFIALFSYGLFCLIYIYNEYKDFKADSISLRERYIASEKKSLRNHVAEVESYIEYMESTTEESLKNSVKAHVYEAFQIAENIYQHNRTSKSLDEIKKLIKNALSPIRFNNGRGYYFAVSMDGVEQLYPVRPEMEGKNLMDLQDSHGNFVIRDEINIIKKSKEGFVKDFWPKPGKNPAMAYPKISFIKYFKPLDWYFGTGEYLDDVKTQIQAEVLERMVDLRFEKEGYFFASTYHGEPLFSNGHLTKGGKNIRDLTDTNGKKIFAEYQKAIKNPDGEFIFYSWQKLNSPTPSPKISFVRAIPEWEWIIGTGAYLDTIETTISKNRTALKKDLTNNILKSLIMLFALLLLCLLWARRVSNKIQTGITFFSSFFQKAATDSDTMIPDDFSFYEFAEIASFANKMLADRTQAEAALRESEFKFRSLFDFSPQAIALTEKKTGRLKDVNHKFCELTQYDRSAVIGKTTIEMGFYTQTDRDRLTAELKAHGEVSGLEMDFKAKDGSILTSLMFCRPIVLGDGPCLLTIFIDITTQKNLEDQLRQAQKMESIGTLSGGIAHDFNNILSIVLGNTELALDDVPEWNVAHGNLEEIKSAGLRAKNIVRQLLAFSRKSDQNLKSVAIVPVIKDALAFLRSTIPSTIDISADIVDAGETVWADPTQLHQIMMNLCINASQAMGETGGKLTVNLESVILDNTSAENDPDLDPGDYVKITVIDTGPGIDRKIIDRIFDPYFTTKGVGKGSGMGLAVVHGIVKNHNGSITVDSEPGKGAVFSILLPKIAQQPDVEVEPLMDLPLGSETILFVDDEPPLMKLGQQMVETLGYTVDATMSPTDAIKRFSSHPDKYDLVITDMTMPEMTGVAMAEKLMSIRSDIPIIICTGYSALIDEEKAKTMDIAAFVMKPMTRQKIARIIRQVLA